MLQNHAKTLRPHLLGLSYTGLLLCRAVKQMGGGDHCAVFGCNNDRRYPDRYVVKSHVKTLKFYSCPEKLRLKWTKAINRENFQVTGSTKVCGNHFREGGKTDTDPIPSMYMKGEQKEKDKRRMLCRKELPTKKPKVACNEDHSYVPSIACHKDHTYVPSPDTSTLPSESISNSVHVSDLETESSEGEGKFSSYSTQDLAREHSYCTTASSAPSLPVTLHQLESEIQKYKELVDIKQHEIEQLQEKVTELEHFGIGHIKDSDELMKLHTGLVNYAKFRWVFEEVKDNIPQLQYYKGKQSMSEKNYQIKGTKKPGPARYLDPENELLLTLMKLRMNLLEEDLALRFGISSSLVSRIISTWVPLLGKELEGLVYWPPSEDIDKYVPECFAKWPRTRAILDCTEIPVQRPSLAKANAQIYSNYKSRPTAKTLVACTPGGTVSFVSEFAGGSMSDKTLVERSAIVDKFAAGDICMADRGFNIQDLLAEKGVKLVIPPFMRKGKTQLSLADNIKTKHVANARIHVERVIGRMKEFRILSSEYPLDMLDILDNVLTVCAALVNLQPPLVPLKK